MECKKVQDRLITEYVDQELDPKSFAEVEGHLKACRACREFSEAVFRTVVAPLKNAKPLEPDGVVWQRIQEKIRAEEKLSTGWFEKLAELLAPFLRPPQLAFRAAFIMMVGVGIVFLMSWPAYYSDPAFAYIEEQATFLSELQAGNTDLLNHDLPDYDEVLNGI
jgi:anti-sigma factor RsiW